MKDGPKAEPSGTVARMEEWTEGGTFGNGDVSSEWAMEQLINDSVAHSELLLLDIANCNRCSFNYFR